MQTKAFSAEYKALTESDGQGIFEALVAVFNNVDRAGEKVMPGAFQESLGRWETKGRPIPVIFAHEWDNLDAHIGQVVEAKEIDSGLYVKGQLDLEEDFARRVWKKMKRGTLAEFSFAYDVVRGEYKDDVYELHELDLLEVGPCLVGMNPETQLLGVKAALGSHSTATSTGAWDGPANEGRVRSGENVAYYRRVYAWQDPEGDPTVKSTYRFIHHEVDGEGNPGPANVRACQTGIGILNGGRGGTTIPEADREGVWAHLARHLRDADVEPPELKAAKVGARHTTKEFEQIQQIHDLSVALGAKCAEQGDGAGADDNEGEGEGKAAADGGRPRALPSVAATHVAMAELE